ncbi:hypothetical protein Tco_0957451 [Tanacetum coccineum]
MDLTLASKSHLMQLYNSRMKMYPRKLKSKGSGPNIVKTVYQHEAIEIADKDGFSFKDNGQRLNKYYKYKIDKDDDEVIEFENGVMSTLAHFDSEIISQTVRAQSSQVPTPLPDDPYVVVRQAYLVDTDTESEPEEAPLEIEEITTSHSSTSLDSTAPLSPDHPLTQASPTPTPTRVSFDCRIARMAVHTHPTISSSMSALIAEVTALSLSSFHMRHRSSYKTSSSSSPPALPIRKRYRDGEGHSLEDEGHGSEDEGPGTKDEEEEAALKGEGLVPSTFEVGQSSRFVPDHEGAERTPPSPEWSSGSLPVSSSPPVVPSSIASPVTTPTTTISVDEDQFLEVGAQLELHGS